MDAVLRPPRADDLDALAELYRACDEVDAPGTVPDAEDVAWRWRTAEFDPSRDAWAAMDDGRALAYAWVFEGLADVRVHPGARGRGLGTRLLRTAERRAAEQGSRDGHLRQNVTNRNAPARRLLETHGYTYSHHYTRMGMDLAERPAPPAPPEGIVVRTYELGPDDRAVHEAFNRAWAQYEGKRWEPEPFERWMDNLESEQFDPAHWHVALDGGEVVAFCLGERYGDNGWVQYLGVIPEQRGRGLGRLVLLRGLAAFFEHAVRRVELAVSSSNVSAARALYESVGMSEMLRYDNLKKPLEAVRAVVSGG